MKEHKNFHKWFLIGLVSIFIAAPGPTIVRAAIQDVDPFLYNALRFFIVSIILLPYLLKHRKTINHKNLVYTLLSASYMTAAVMSFVLAIKLSQASYVAVIQLLSPLVFMFFSTRLTGEKISRNAKIGITLAALGAFVIIFIPIALAQNEAFVFYPEATFLGMINCIALPLSLIYYRKANEAGLPIVSVFALSSLVVTLLCSLAVLAGGHIALSTVTEPSVLWSIIYMSVGIALVSRILNVASYERVGSAVASALGYLEIFLAILIPIVVLDESLSLEVVIGGVLILCGVYIAEHHKSEHHKHFHIFRHH